MATFKKYHGISMVADSFIENLNLEPLAADPSVLSPGRLWYNTTDKLIKFSTLDSEGAVIAKVVGDDGAIGNVQTQIDALKAGNESEGSIAYQVKQAVDAVMGGVTPEAVDTLNELAAAINNDGDFAGTVTNQIATAKSEVEAAVAEDISTINATIGTMTTNLTNLLATVGADADGTVTARSGSNYLDGVGNIYAEVLALDAALFAVHGRVSSLESSVGDLTNLNTADQTNLVSAINEVLASAEDLTEGLKGELDSRVATYLSTENGGAALTHTFSHGFTGEAVTFDVKVVEGSSRVYDSLLVENNPITGTVTVSAVEAIDVVIVAEDKSPLIPPIN